MKWTENHIPMPEEGKANARLIAATPDLLKVCQEILAELLDESSPVYLTVEQEIDLRHAVAKAVLLKAQPEEPKQ